MKKKMLFSETRFVFVKPGEGGGAGAGAGGSTEGLPTAPGEAPETAAAEAAAKKAAAEAAAKKAKLDLEVKEKAAKERARKRTEMDLDQLEKDIVVRYSVFENSTRLPEDFKIIGKFNKDLKFTSIEAACAAKVKVALSKNPEEMKGIADIFDLKPEDVPEAVGKIYGRSFVKKVEKDFKAKYTLAKEFFQIPGNEGEEFGYTLTVNSRGKLKATFDDVFDKAYEQAKPILKERAETAAEAAEAEEAGELTDEQYIKALKTTPFYGILKALGFGKHDPEPDGPTGFQKLAKGEHPLLSWLLGFAKYPELGHGIFESTIDIMPDNIKKPVLARRDKLPAKFSGENWKRPKALAAKLGAKPVKNKDLVPILKGGPMPAKGVKLAENYSIPEEGLEIDFTRSASMTIPKSTSLYVDGDRLTVAEGEGDPKKFDSSDGKKLFEGVIPAGTVFKGQQIAFNMLEKTSQTA
jgi:hypothetical protein